MEPARRKLSDSPWFWVYLFGVAALIALFLIGNKADRVQEQRDQNFTRRQHSLELQASAVAQDQEESPHAKERFVRFTPFYVLLGVVTVFAWIMHWRDYYYSERRTAGSTLMQGPA
jgi:hypothetical protein